jgi:hypothetical protein
MNNNNILFRITKKEVEFNRSLSKFDSKNFEQFLALKFIYEKRYQDFLEKRDIYSTISSGCALTD